MTSNLKKIYGTNGIGKRNGVATPNEVANIKTRIRLHEARMIELMDEGMERSRASTQAFNELQDAGWRT